jgi:hypothetical protein
MTIKEAAELTGKPTDYDPAKLIVWRPLDGVEPIETRVPTESASQARQRSTVPRPFPSFSAVSALKMARGGIEPPTRGFSVLCSAN